MYLRVIYSPTLLGFLALSCNPALLLCLMCICHANDSHPVVPHKGRMYCEGGCGQRMHMLPCVQHAHPAVQQAMLLMPVQIFQSWA